MALDAVRFYLRERGYAPSMRDLARVLSKGHTTVLATVTRLERKGYLTKPSGKIALARAQFCAFSRVVSITLCST